MNSNNPDDSTEEAPSASDSMSEIPLDRAEAGVSLPAPDEVRMSARSSGVSRSGLNKILWVSCGCLVFIAIFIGLVVGLAGDGGGGSGGGDSARAEEPTARKFSYEALADYLVENGISTEEQFNDKDTPQARAAHWIANEDPRNLDLPDSSVGVKSGYHFMTRYVLATIYYSLSGPSWRYKFNFLTNNDVCSWRGTLYVITTGQPVPFGALCDATGEVAAIYLDGNSLDGTVPEEITALVTLRVLDMNFNDNVKGKLPSDIGKLSLLNRIAFSQNQLTGPIPDSICDAVFLEQIYMRYNSLSGRIPSCIGSLKSLEILQLANNLLTGPVPGSIAELSSIEGLWLDDNMLSGDITMMFIEMPFLRGLYLEDNSFQGRIDENFLNNNRLLLHIDLSNNDMTGEVPAHFFDPVAVPFLEMLDFHNNRLAGVLPNGISSNNTEMNFLSLHNNFIEGNVPESWVNFRGLFHLDLSSNELEGPIPDHIGNMTQLSYLFLANNSFTPGPIPDSFAQLTNLEELSLKSTGRTGGLPEWMPTLDELILLDLDQNLLVGNIPSSYGNMTNLQFLLLNRNNLVGQVPASFSQLTNLRAVFLEMNALTGRLDVLCDLPAFQEVEGDSDGTEILAADCVGGEKAPVVCKCCSICCIPGFSDQPHEDTCHDQTAIAHLDPLWERIYARTEFKFGNDTRFVDRDWIN